MGGSMRTATRKENALLRVVANRIWVLFYTVEEARQYYADRQQLLRQAAACIVLSLFRLAGGIHHG